MKWIDRREMLETIEQEARLTGRLTGRPVFDARVMAAMAKVQREEFVPEEIRFQAFENHPLPIGQGQTISQPYIVALMTDLLDSQPEQTILEIGTGSGYQSAILSLLVKKVYSVEIVSSLAAGAAGLLDRLGYDNIEVRAGDGNAGWPEKAPFDGIIVTAAAPFVPRPLVEQLAVGGRLVIPVGRPYMAQELLVLEKGEKGEIRTTDVLGVAFVPLVGGAEQP